MGIPTAQLESLYASAQAATQHAYAPYSQFRVGAALLFADGSIVTGCNVENVSFGLTICAERSALVRAISEQGAARRIVAIAVANANHAASPPCGACRQVLSEFVTEDAVVLFAGRAGTGGKSSEPTKLAFSELFPHGFRLDAKPLNEPAR